MSIVAPRRSEALVDRQGRPTSRLAEYLEAVARELPDTQSPTVESDFTITDESIVFVTAPGNITINLPAVTVNRKIIIKKQSQTGKVTIIGAEKIDGESTRVLDTQYQTLTIYGDGTSWNIV